MDAVIRRSTDGEVRVIEAAIIMALCFAAGYGLHAGLAARSRRRRMFRS